jgi:hypothetical protein
MIVFASVTSERDEGVMDCFRYLPRDVGRDDAGVACNDAGKKRRANRLHEIAGHWLFALFGSDNFIVED